jgi:hypothetical protein
MKGLFKKYFFRDHAHHVNKKRFRNQFLDLFDFYHIRI